MVRWLVVVVIIAFISWQFINKPQPGLEISVQELKTLLNQEPSPILIDVRQSSEFKEVSIPNSISIPLGELETSPLLEEIGMDTPIVLICRSGSRSGFAQQILLDIGYQEVYNLAGGIIEWSKEAK